MSLRLLTIAMLALGALIPTWRAARRDRRDVTVWMHIPASLLLYFALFPPLLSVRGDSLIVLTSDASPRQRRSMPFQRAVALPGAPAPAGTESVPDLATALRKYPDVRQLTVLGAGLSPRDRPVAAALSLRFDPSPAHGLIELQAPATVLLGHEWTLHGRAAAPAVRAELHDPSGALVDAGKPDAEGRFTLSATARGEGAVRFELRMFDAKQNIIDTASVPLIVQGGQGMRVIVRAGAANPELKYWRRWASDAGIRLDVSEGLTQGVVLRDGDTHLSPTSLAQTDLVSIDARAWASLDASEKSALRSAVADGLGLLLRADGALAPDTAADWKSFGYGIDAGTGRTVTIDRYTGLRERTPFTAAPVRVAGAGIVPMLEADDGNVLAWWHAQGQGRVGLWLLADSYQLVLLGAAARYASLWSDTLDRLARPRAAAPPQPTLPLAAWVGERAIFCGLGSSASVLTPAHDAVSLLQDPSGCAAYWPGRSGWHALHSAAGDRLFYVRADDDGRNLRSARDRAATAGMVGTADAVDTAGAAGTVGTTDAANAANAAATASTVGAPSNDRLFANGSPDARLPLPRWPFFSAWILATGAIWWCERRKADEGH